MKYLKEFVIGSSIAVTFHFYYMAYHHRPKKLYNYFDYSMAAPLWFGLWNIVSLIIAQKYGLSKRMRFFVVSILSFLTIATLQQTVLNAYIYTREEWQKYYMYLFIKYMVTWNIVIYYLDKYV